MPGRFRWGRRTPRVLGASGGAASRLALTALAADLAGTPPDCRQFFDALFKAPPRTSTVRELARTLGVLPSTLMSRFFRARLPAPKRYLAYARLTQWWVARSRPRARSNPLPMTYAMQSAVSATACPKRRTCATRAA